MGGDPKAAAGLPFLDEEHISLREEVSRWAGEHLPSLSQEADVDLACRRLVRDLGRAGWLRYVVGGREYGGVAEGIDVRSVCLIRETLAYHSSLAEFAFAMQGLGSGPISLYGTQAQRRRYLPRVVAGEAVAAFALSEPGAGSDAAALECRAYPDGDGYVLEGEKTWISNGGIADFYVVFARTDGEGPGGISAFIVDAEVPGLRVKERIQAIAPHPLAHLVLEGCRVAREQVLGGIGEGFRIAMATLDLFRISVAAAALGFARRALEEATRYALQRRMFGTTLARMQLTRARLAQMVVDLEAATLLTYRAAWLRDRGFRVTKEAAMAKVFATERAQAIIDGAVQMMGGLGVKGGEVVESLFRAIRPLRIYEGASEIQWLIIAREVLREYGEEVGVR
ncbi:MAG: acyl-CoA dehydrogenase family protein [Thermus sp.]|uniref:acyl-CoA dehydrogenase family protein n=1 Tax=Thermus sp. TaxID=275 RepID=UPI0025EF556F|nr:acyl-CoA dehydrogenase family protein [Thermus sp.]MCS6867748.1 acyl-CoA dehydrogenase family protein [Thermus sp.]MCS7219267.1 acyl-CoA dehydrogenase family protein [Thermus sp.]MDW8018226.1 acyl-CoA dehydrogenase family protein [Thermus sp.]